MKSFIIKIGIILLISFLIAIDNKAANDTIRIPEDYKSLAGAITNEVSGVNFVTGDINIIIRIDSAFIETGPIAISFTGDATHQLYIETTSGQKHLGVWDSNKYYLTRSSDNILLIGSPWVNITGIQFYLSSTDDADAEIYFYDVNTNGNAIIKDCILRGPGDCGNHSWTEALQIYDGSGALNIIIINSVIYDWMNVNDAGGLVIYQANCSLFVYNCTINNCITALHRGSSGGFIKTINSLFYGNTTDVSDPTNLFDSSCATTNTSDGGLTASSRGNRFSQDFTFTDSANKNFNLVFGDTAARDRGVSLSSIFSTDILGNDRPYNSVWDIGAFEFTTCTEPVISYGVVPVCSVGVAFQFNPATLTGNYDSVKIDSLLPTGIIFTETGTNAGKMSGTPTIAFSGRQYTVTVYGCETSSSVQFTLSSTYNPCIVPTVETGTPLPGRRMWQQLAAYSAYDSVRHMIYLPPSYNGVTKYPVLIELPGNTNNAVDGPTENYWPVMGYGMSRGDGYIWISVPFLYTDGDSICHSFWEDGSGDNYPDHTVTYMKALLAFIKTTYSIDTNKIVLIGFSRGSVGSALVGLADDAIASQWLGFHMSAYGDVGYGGDAGPRIERIRFPVLLSVGNDDGFKSNVEAYYNRLVDSAVTTKLWEIPDYDHNIRWIDNCSNVFSDSVVEWLTDLIATADLVPVIDSVKCHVQRDEDWDFARIGDTVTLYTNEISDSSTSCAVWINRGMTITATVVRWFNTSGKDSVWVKIPTGVPLNYYYRMRIRNKFGRLNNEPTAHNLHVIGRE